MARISGVTIPSEKQVHVALTYIYGIGPKTSADILAAAKVEPTVRVKDLTDEEIGRIQDIINNKYVVEGELQRIVAGNIKRLKDIGIFVEFRHIKAHSGIQYNELADKLAKQGARAPNNISDIFPRVSK